MRKFIATLVMIAMAVAGIAGATFVVSADNAQTQIALGNAIASNDPLFAAKATPQNMAGTIVDANGTVIDSMFARGPYDWNDPSYSGPYLTAYAKLVSSSDNSAVIRDANGNPIDSMDTPTQAAKKHIDAENAANPRFKKGTPVALYDTNTAGGQGVKHVMS